MENPVSIRRANVGDTRRLWHWRNDPQTRRMSRFTGTVSLEAHEIWLESVLADPGKMLLIGCLPESGEAIGMVRFDCDGNRGIAVVSINLNPDFRGRSLAAGLLEAAISYFEQDNPMPLHAEIRPDNAASIRLFEKAGFEQEASGDMILHYVRPVQSATRT